MTCSDELKKEPESSLVDRPYISQPATTAIQIALVRLLSSWNIHPLAVIGHSSGEIAAAYASGALSAKSCMLIAYHRGALTEELKVKRPERPGRMLAVGASPAVVRPMLRRLGSAQVAIACVNGPSLVTASGDERGILRLQAITENESLLNRQLKVDIAYHSPHMEDICSEYLESIKIIEPCKTNEVDFHSSVRGHQIDTRCLSAEYWVENLRNPVLFLDGVQSMYKGRHCPDVLVEIGPHSTLEAPIRDIMKNPQWASRPQYFSTLKRGQDAALTALSLASALFVLGSELNFTAINHSSSAIPTFLGDLPAYPWNHSKRHWHESRLSVNHRLKRFPRSDLLGSLVDDYNDLEPRWRNLLRISEVPWLSHHKVQGSTIFPLTGYLAMAIEAAFQHATLHEVSVSPTSRYQLREVEVSRSMVLYDDIATEVSLVLRPQREGSRITSKTWYHFEVFSWGPESGWVEHCQGLISVLIGDQKPNPINGMRHMKNEEAFIQARNEKLDGLCQKILDPVNIYSRFSGAGLEFGPAFRNITAASAAIGHSTAIISVPDTTRIMPNNVENTHIIHPGTFDACFQVIDFATSGGDLSQDDLYVPTFVKDLTISHGIPKAPGHQFIVRASAEQAFSNSDSDIHASLSVFDGEHMLIEVDGFVVSKLPNQNSSITSSNDRGLCFKMVWEPCLDLLVPEQYSEIVHGTLATSDFIIQMEMLERAAFYHVESTLANVTAEEADRFPSHLQKLYRVLATMLDQGHQGALPLQNPSWGECPKATRQEFLQHLKDTDDSGRLICNMGERLISVLRGEIDPLSIMLHENMLSAYYRAHDGIHRGNELGAQVIAKLAHQAPQMKIIEIGAGTGTATMPVLRTLGQDFGHYDFTDISAGFFESAKKEQTAWADRMGERKPALLELQFFSIL